MNSESTNGGNAQQEYILDDDECPLAILMNHPSTRGEFSRVSIFHRREERKERMRIRGGVKAQFPRASFSQSAIGRDENDKGRQGSSIYEGEYSGFQRLGNTLSWI